MSVVSSAFRRRPKYINVKLPGRRVEKWHLIWDAQRKNQCHIGRGWYAFVRSHLVHGDKVRFLKSPHSEVIRVMIVYGDK